MGRWLPPTKGATWTNCRCDYCGRRVVSSDFGVVVWCENYRDWNDGLDNNEVPDEGETCGFILASG